MLSTLKRTGARLRDWAYTLPAPPALRGLVTFVIRVVRNYGDHDGPHAAAGIAYYALFSLFPLVLGTLTIASLFMGSAEAQDQIIAFLDEQVPGLEDNAFLRQNIEGVVDARGIMGAVSILTLFWAGRGAFMAIRRIANRAWKVDEKPHFIMMQLTNFAATLAIGGTFLLTLFASTAGRALVQRTAFVQEWVPFDLPFGLLLALVPFLFTLTIFLIIYRFVPDTKVPWSAAAAGAVLAATALELLKFGFTIYLSEFANYEQIYGNLSTVIIVLFGFFLTAQIFVIGAEVSSEFARSRQGQPLNLRKQLVPVPGGLAPPDKRERQHQAEGKATAKRSQR
ncbi:MAG: YihY/virulence factor BrkB family protein [Dehalococcoidia bacterium]